MENNLLFNPFGVGDCILKNRFVLTGLGTGLPGSDGSVTEEYIAYMRERAKGGVGLLITEVVRPCDGHALTARYQLSAAHDHLIPGMKKLADAVHEYGAKIFFQLHHPGRETFDEILGGIPAVAPSAIPCPVNKATTREIETDEIHELVRQFGKAAARVKAAGIDGIEFHGAHGYLIHQFLSPWTNRRTDGYGGSFERMFRFAGELIDEVRKTCGDSFPIAFRFSIEDFMGDKAIDLKLGIQIAKRLEEAGVDLLDASMGFYETSINNMLETAPHFQGWRNLHLKELSKHLSHKIPLLSVNSARALPFAEYMVESGMTDLVGMGRTFLADPEWVNNSMAGRSDEIRPCLSCVYCVESLRHNAAEDGEKNTCAVNVRSFNENKYRELAKDGIGHKVAVIGAGPSGLECALVLAQRGFGVDIYEKKSRIGGQLNIASKPKDKYRIEALVQFYETSLKLHGVNIHTDTAISPENEYLLQAAEAIFVSTGSVPIAPNAIPGVSLGNVHSTEDILLERVQPRNKRIAVIGSGLTGLETAEFLAARSNVVYVFDMLDEIGKDIYFQHKEDILAALEPYAVKFFASHQLEKISPVSITAKDLVKETSIEVPVDAVVLSLGMKPDDSLYIYLTEKLSVPVMALGDTRKIGRIKDAVHDGYNAAFAFKL
jgi:2,4-dienoyl-CoA reductase-like NADH-dependent reductase (Old Yellow Enzyme family)/thioredoxin reductase